MKRKRLLLIAFIILSLLLAGWIYYLYQKPRIDVATVKPIHLLTAQKLFSDFVTDEAAADKKYTDKIIEVRGIVSEVQQMDNTAIVLLAVENSTGGINCSLRHTNAVLPAKGETVTIKGRCTGFLIDVNLIDAVFVK